MQTIVHDGVTITLTPGQVAEVIAGQANPTFWEPSKENPGWYVDLAGIVKLLPSHIHYKVGGFGQIFQTEKLAQIEANRLKAQQTLKKAVFIANNGWTPNFKDGNSVLNFYVEIRNGKINYDSWNIIQSQPTWMYVKSSKIAKEIAEQYEAEFRLLLA